MTDIDKWTNNNDEEPEPDTPYQEFPAVNCCFDTSQKTAHPHVPCPLVTPDVLVYLHSSYVSQWKCVIARVRAFEM